jgi:hypothetical protein
MFVHDIHGWKNLRRNSSVDLGHGWGLKRVDVGPTPLPYVDALTLIQTPIITVPGIKNPSGAEIHRLVWSSKFVGRSVRRRTGLSVGVEIH